MALQYPASWFHFDALAAVMSVMVGFTALCVGSFAWRYMRGDGKFRVFYARLTLMIAAVCVMVAADHLLLFWSAWCAANLLLVRLMVHKSAWQAARASGRLAARNYVIGALCVAAGLMMLYAATGETSIRLLVHRPPAAREALPALLLLLAGAMTQSAIWPFHRWLISSLNSPTPVSAIMHAGLVNGGGFLLVRFAPLYLEQAVILPVIFTAGMITALLGTLWKLMQSDVKRMLACSTMGQMGFMMAQCGLGLFPAAVAHLVWHGLFKAYLFLASGGVAQEKRMDPGYPPGALSFACALVCGLAGSLSFAYACGKSWMAGDTTLVLMVVTLIAATQLALPLLRRNVLRSLPGALALTTLLGAVYGGSVQLIASCLEPMAIMQPQPLQPVHLAGIAALVLAWLSLLFLRNPAVAEAWRLKAYVRALNAGQPHASTITAHRNHYRFQ